MDGSYLLGHLRTHLLKGIVMFFKAVKVTGAVVLTLAAIAAGAAIVGVGACLVVDALDPRTEEEKKQDRQRERDEHQKQVWRDLNRRMELAREVRLEQEPGSPIDIY